MRGACVHFHTDWPLLLPGALVFWSRWPLVLRSSSGPCLLLDPPGEVPLGFFPPWDVSFFFRLGLFVGLCFRIAKCFSVLSAVAFAGFAFYPRAHWLPLCVAGLCSVQL